MLAAAVRRGIRQKSQDSWAAAWKKETTGKRTKRLITTPAKKVLQYWKGLRKVTTSVLMQLRTGKIGLSAYLTKINVSETARCGCDLGNQTPEHVLMECPLLHELRREMRRQLWKQEVIMLRYEDLLLEPKAAMTVAEFMVKTGLLGQFQAVDHVAMGSSAKDPDESNNVGNITTKNTE